MASRRKEEFPIKGKFIVQWDKNGDPVFKPAPKIKKVARHLLWGADPSDEHPVGFMGGKNGMPVNIPT